MSPNTAAAGHRAAKESAAAFELTGWTTLALAGADAVKFLHNFCTADVKSLPPDRACEAFFTNVKARVVGHALLLADHTPDGTTLTLIGSPGQGEKLAAHLDRYLITEKVTIENTTAARGMLFVTGPQVAERMRAAGLESPRATADAGRPPRADSHLDGSSCRTIRTDEVGLPGYLVLTPATDMPTILAKLASAGVEIGAPDAFEALRIESRFPLYGIDVTEDHLAPEVGRPWAINYTKGCYLGQEPIARIDALGHVNRSLCGLRIGSGALPEPGVPVLVDDKEIGKVTSAAATPADGAVLALAYLRTKFTEPGTNAFVRTAGGDVPAVVTGPAATL